MKKIILKIMATLTLTVAFTFLSPSLPIMAFAETTTPATSEEILEEGIVPETEASVWFKEKIMPYILKYGMVFLGTASALIAFLRKHKKALAELIGAYNALKKSNEDNEQTKAEVDLTQTRMLEWQKRQEERMQEYFDKQDERMLQRFDEIASKVTNRIEDACETAHKLLEVEELAYEDNPALVSQGTAKKIAEVIHNGEEKKNKP